jgi:hypothetical protein
MWTLNSFNEKAVYVHDFINTATVVMNIFAYQV